jgi:hypothetical protein
MTSILPSATRMCRSGVQEASAPAVRRSWPVWLRWALRPARRVRILHWDRTGPMVDRLRKALAAPTCSRLCPAAGFWDCKGDVSRGPWCWRAGLAPTLRPAWQPGRVLLVLDVVLPNFVLAGRRFESAARLQHPFLQVYLNQSGSTNSSKELDGVARLFRNLSRST